ncbi:MAG: glycosyltransferase family 9 protein [Candidatus Zixiibacteriota bacterium]
MRILLIRYSSLGDVVLAGAVPRAIQRAVPDADITFITKQAYQPIVEHFDARMTVIGVDPQQSLRNSHRSIAETHFHAVIDLHASLRSLRTAFTLRASKRVRVDKYTWRRRRMVKQKRGLDEPLSVVDNYLRAARRAIPDLDDDEPKLVLTPEEHARAEELRLEIPGAIGIGWGARWPTKAVPGDLWSSVLDRLKDHGVAGVRLFGMGPDKTSMADFAGHLGPLVNRALHVDLALPDLMCHLRACSLYLGPDSGLTHMAAALGVPTVAVFGPTHPSLGFAPVGSHTRTIHSGTWCSPCHKHGAAPCFRERRFCFTEIDPDVVVAAIHDLLPDGRITT